MKKIFCTIFLFSITFLLSSQNIKVEVEGDATFNNSLFSVSEAGEDFPSSIESETSVFISVINGNLMDKFINQNNKWRIFVQKTDVQWDTDLILEAKRTGKGYKPNRNGRPNIHNGDNFQVITNNPTYFFNGKSEVAFIPINLKLNGFSIVMGAKDFETNVVFTVYDNW